MRLDKYLKVSRLIKRRTVANEACDAGRVLVNGKPAGFLRCEGWRCFGNSDGQPSVKSGGTGCNGIRQKETAFSFTDCCKEEAGKCRRAFFN